MGIASRWTRFHPEGLTLLLVLTLGQIWLMGGALLWAPTLPTGGDLAAHLLPLHEFVTRILPSGSVSGWTFSWFAGMPLYTFYFPLPALLVAALKPIVGFAVAVKWIVALGPLLLPLAIYSLLAGIGLARTPRLVGTATGSLFVLMQSYSILGGNLLSTLQGEFSYSISLALSLFYLACVCRAVRTGEEAALGASALLALTALSHVLTTAAVVLATLPLFLSSGSGSRTVRSSWVLGFLFAGFWAFPFLARLPFSATPHWLVPRVGTDLLPVELIALLPLAAWGAWQLLRDRQTRIAAQPLLMLPVVGALVYLLPQDHVHRGRLLPYLYLGIHILAGVGLGLLLAWAARTRTRPAIGLATAACWLPVALTVARDPRQLHARAITTMAGYEHSVRWEEYRQLVDELSGLAAGRVFWEDSPRVAEYGSPDALKLIPYWSPQHAVLDGLWIESSATSASLLRLRAELTPAPSLVGDAAVPPSFDLTRGIERATALGGRYFIAFSDEVRTQASGNRALRSLRASPDWEIFEVRESTLIEPLRFPPVVAEGSAFAAASQTWLDLPSVGGRALTQSGPSDWARVGADLEELFEVSPLTARGKVSDVVVGGDRIEFKTTALGVPHYVRASWFPNWRASGAEGPYRAAPGLMVVVPRRETVSLHYIDTWAEWVGRALTLVGLFSGIAMARGATSAAAPRPYGYRGH